MMRTAKACGPDVAVLASSCAKARALRDDGGKRAVLRGDHAISRKAIAQGMPECSGCSCMLVCAFLVRNCTRDRGCSKHPAFPAPSLRDSIDASLGLIEPRERERILACRPPRTRGSSTPRHIGSIIG